MTTNKNRLTRVTTSLLPIDDIVNLLRYKYDFVDKEVPATDVKYVNGVSADNIAISVEGDRETVKNSMQLGGLEADQYLTAAEGGKIQSSYTGIVGTYSQEIRGLRDELYQLKAELNRKGLVTDYNSYLGFQDVFKSSDVQYHASVSGTIIDVPTKANEIKVDEATFASLQDQDFIVLYFRSNERHHVARITKKNVDGTTIEFAPSSPFNASPSNAVIYKTLGSYHNGMFAFLEPAKNKPTSATSHSTLDDDTYKIRRQISKPNSGFAYSFRINDNMFDVNGITSTEGYINDFKIKAARYGSPSALTAYLIRESDIPNFKNPDQAADDELIIAKSKPVMIEEEMMEKLVTFDFHDGENYPVVSLIDPMTSERIRHAIVIEAGEEIDEANYYRVLFLQNKTGSGATIDLQLNNIVHEYNRSDSDARSMVTNAAINNSDMFYSLTTRGMISDSLTAYREGVYTKRIKLDDVSDISRARLMLRINREGYYKTSNIGPSITRDGDTVAVVKDPALAKHYDMLTLGGIGAKNYEDNVVVGNSIRKLNGQSADGVMVDKGIYLEDASDIYRVGYKVYLRASHKKFDPITYSIQTHDEAYIELPLTAVMSDRKKRSKKISDRLIFENEFVSLEDGAARYFNEFELQIHWKSEYTEALLNDEVYSKDFFGAIHDLTLAFDRSL